MTPLENITDRGGYTCQTVILGGGMGYIGGWVPITTVSYLPSPCHIVSFGGIIPFAKYELKNLEKNFGKF